jgi:hypothetical protein
MEVDLSDKFGTNSISPLHKLMTAAVAFLAATGLLIVNFFGSLINGAATNSEEGKAFYLVPLALALYYACVWWVVARRRPEREGIVVQYKPPDGITPAEARHLYTLNCDGRTYVACAVALAARGLLAIEQTRDGVCLRSAIELPGPGSSVPSTLPDGVPEEERAVFHDLFRQGPIAFLRPPRQELLLYIGTVLQKRSSARYYDFRAGVLMVGLAVMSLSAIRMASAEGLLTSATGGFDFTMAAFLGASVFSAGIASHFFWQHNGRAVLLAWRGIYHYRTALFLLGALFIMPGLFWFAMHIIAPVLAGVTALMLLVNTFAPPFLMGYTAQGNRVMRQLLGFRRFLESTEQDRLNRLNPAREDAKSDLSLLAYAIALDVREAWGDRLGVEAMVETALDGVL